MSNIQTQSVLVHLDSGLAVPASYQYESFENAFTPLAVEVSTADEAASLGDIITPRTVSVRLVSGDPVFVGLVYDGDGSGVYTQSAREAGESCFFSLITDTIRETNTIVCEADMASSLSGLYIDLDDRNGTVRAWFNMVATVASGSITYGTPAAGIKAQGNLALTGMPIADKIVTIDAVTYTWKATVGTTANQVLIGASEADSILNLTYAIKAENGAGQSGTKYGSDTVVHPTVTAAPGTLDSMDVEALLAGYAGNVTSTTDMSNGSWGSGTLTGGLNATYFVVDGTTYTYDASPAGNEFSTIGELAALIEADPDLTASVNVGDIDIVASVAGTAGNAITLALGTNMVGSGTADVSGATLTGGSAASTPPATPGGGRLLPVVVVEDDADTAVAAALQSALDADAEFVATVLGATVTVLDRHTGARTPIADGGTTWTLLQTQEGKDSPVVHLKSAGTSQVVVAIAPN